MSRSFKGKNRRVPSVAYFAGMVLISALTGCATQPAPQPDDAAGLLSGFLHGLIALPALVASLFAAVRIYAFPNSGFGYDLGFCIGFAVSMAWLLLPTIPIVGAYLTRNN